jgi:hypothetical protein
VNVRAHLNKKIIKWYLAYENKAQAVNYRVSLRKVNGRHAPEGVIAIRYDIMAESDESGDEDVETPNPKKETVWRLLRDNDSDPAELLHTYRNFNVHATPEGARFIYLREACMQNVKMRIVRGLVTCGASFKQIGRQGMTPFLQACLSAYVLTHKTAHVEWLLETYQEARDAVNQVTRRNSRGHGETFENSPLEIASYFGNHVLARLLLKYGADLTHVDDCGRTPVQSARWWANSGRPTLLCGHMRDIEVADILELADAMGSVGEWRPRTHARFPAECRRTMRTLLLLAKSYLSREDGDDDVEQKRVIELKPRYPVACLSLLPEEILQFLFANITHGPFPDAWFECVHLRE